MRSAENLSIRAVRRSQMQEWQERARSRQVDESKAVEAELSRQADTLFGWSDKAVGSDNLKTGRKTV